MLFPIFAFIFSSTYASISLIALTSSSPMLHFIVSNLLQGTLTELIFYIVLFFHCKIYIWCSFTDFSYLVKLPIFSFCFPQCFTYFVEHSNHNSFSIFIWELQCLDYLWSVVTLLFDFVLSLGKHYPLIECVLFCVKNGSGLCCVCSENFFSNFFFFPGREYIVWLSKFSQEVADSRLGW